MTAEPAVHAFDDVPARTPVRLSNLTAERTTVAVDPSIPGIRVRVYGNASYQKSVTAKLVGRVLEVTESGGGAGSISVSGGGVSISGSVSGVIVTGGGRVAVGGRSVSIGNGVTQINTFGRGGRVIVDGVDVTNAASGGGSAEPYEATAVHVIVPPGTDLGIDDCSNIHVDRVGGRIRADLSMEGRLTAVGARDVDLDLSGACRVGLDIIDGCDVHVDASGSCAVAVGGSVGGLDLDLSGACSVTSPGSGHSFGRVSGNASGACNIAINGQVGSDSVKTSGVCQVLINGRAPGSKSSGRWGF